MKKYIFIVSILFLNNLFIHAETKTALRSSELNVLIQDHIRLNYPDYSIVEAFKVNRQGVISYEVTILKEKTRFILHYNSKGEFIRKQIPVNKKITPSYHKKR